MLSIGNLTFKSPLVLSPMAGISSLPYRMLNRSFGCELAFTEMISINALAHKSARTLPLIATTDDDGPLGIQIVGSDPELIKRSLDIVSQYDFKIVDFNSACPVKKVASKGRGAGLLKEPEKLQDLVRLIVNYTDRPVTVKIRSGWDKNSVNAVEVARRIEDAGASGLFIHGRTRAQGYSGTVDYNIIREVKESIRFPLIASGDALSPLLIKKLFDETGCDGVAVARGALGNPWIFPETSALLAGNNVPLRPDIHEKIRAMKSHLVSNAAFYGERVGVIQFRKFYGWYTKGMPAKELRKKAFAAQTVDEMLCMIDSLRELGTAEEQKHRSKDTRKTEPGTGCPRPSIV